MVESRLRRVHWISERSLLSGKAVASPNPASLQVRNLTAKSEQQAVSEVENRLRRVGENSLLIQELNLQRVQNKISGDRIRNLELQLRTANAAAEGATAHMNATGGSKGPLSRYWITSLHAQTDSSQHLRRATWTCVAGVGKNPWQPESPANEFLVSLFYTPHHLSTGSPPFTLILRSVIHTNPPNSPDLPNSHDLPICHSHVSPNLPSGGATWGSQSSAPPGNNTNLKRSRSANETRRFDGTRPPLPNEKNVSKLKEQASQPGFPLMITSSSALR